MKFPLMAAICFLLCMDASAQKMITFESRPISTKNKKSRGDDGKNSLTIGLASVVNGYTPVYYERTLSPSFTIQVGAGITYRSIMNDIGMLFYNDGQESDYFAGGWDVTDDYTIYSYRDTRIGQYFSISPKYYFGQSALNGTYISPMLEIKNYSYSANTADETVDAKNYGFYYDDANVPRSANRINEHMKCLDLTFCVGGHYQTASHLSVGWNVSLGVRSVSSERLDVGVQVVNGNEEYFANRMQSSKAVRPLFAFNFIMGGWF